MPSLKRGRRSSPKPPSIESEEESSICDSSDSSEVEVTLNILERQPRITAGKRTKVISGEEAQTDSAFWGSEQHRTWEESESDSEVSYDLEADESESSSDLDEAESEDSSESEDDGKEADTRKRKSGFKAYFDPRDKPPASVVKVKKTIVRKKASIDEKIIERVGTRDTTRARTQEVIVRVEKGLSKKRLNSRHFEPEFVPLTQEQLMEEARQTEEWNTADLQAYIRYMELSDKERASHMMTAKAQRSSSDSKIFRSFIRNNEVQSEIRLFGTTKPEVVLAPIKRATGKYRYRYEENVFFSTPSEFLKIHNEYIDNEKSAIRAIIADLNNRI